MLLRDLTIENYRSFEKYRLNGLARVNMLVGDNNCGKTSVLEAGYLLASQGDIPSLRYILSVRDDKSFASPDSPIGGGEPLVHANSLFRDHDDTRWDIPDGRILLTGKAVVEQKLANISLAIIGSSGTTSTTTTPAPGTWQPPSSESVVSTEYTNADRTVRQEAQIDAFGRLGTKFKSYSTRELKRSSSFFVPWRGLTTDQVASVWDGLLRRQLNSVVVDALKLVDPRIDDIKLSPITQHLSDILVDIGNARQSMSRLGGGVLCMLYLACGIAFCSKGGVVFIDEIDTGLHYSRLADMWRMVIRTAKDLDVQVFATTHSNDCIRGLADAVREEEDFVDEVAIFRIDRRTDEAIRYSGSELDVIVNHEIEVR